MTKQNVQQLTETEMMDLLKQAIKESGSQKNFAEKIGVSRGYLSDIVQGRKPLADKISIPLGFSTKTVLVFESTNGQQ